LSITDEGTYTYNCVTLGPGLVPSCQASYPVYTANPITVFLTGNNGAIRHPFSLNINPNSADCPGPKCPLN
jgi:hypothetical protein